VVARGRRARRGAVALSVAALALGALAAVTPASPAVACGDATIVHGSFDFITNYTTPSPAPTDVIFEATAVGGDGSWSASTRATDNVIGGAGAFSLGCLDAGTIYEFWFDVDGGNGHSYLFHVGTEYPNAFQHETDSFPQNPGWFTLDMRSPTGLTAPGPTGAPTDVIEIPSGAGEHLIIAPTTGLDRPVQFPSTGPDTATLPPRDVTLAANGAQVTLHADTEVTSSTTWDGTMMLPTSVTPDHLPEGATDVVGVRLGAASMSLALSAPARILLLGQAGKAAGFVPEGGAFAPIDARCAADTAAGLGGSAECAVDVGPDLVIWTTHFTSFVAYTPAPAAPGPSLAATGDEPASGVLLGLAMLLAGGTVLVAVAARRRRSGPGQRAAGAAD